LIDQLIAVYYKQAAAVTKHVLQLVTTEELQLFIAGQMQLFNAD
jgi:hypothetical protein